MAVRWLLATACGLILQDDWPDDYVLDDLLGTVAGGECCPGATCQITEAWVVEREVVRG